MFILEHNLGRFGTDLYHHTQPFWYYLPVALLALVPWTVFVIAAAAETIRAWWTEKRELFPSEDALPAFLVIWLVVPIAFFSLSASKLPGYIVPAIPAGTLLLAEYVRRHVIDDDTMAKDRPSLLMIVLHSVDREPTRGRGADDAVHCVSTQPAVEPGDRRSQPDSPSVLAIGIAPHLATTDGASTIALRHLRCPVVLAVASVLRLGAPALDATLSARPLAQEISRVDNRSLPLAILRLSRETEYGLHFYRDQKIARYEAGEAPAGEHLLAAPEGSQKNMAKWITGRRITYLGSFAPQGVDYYWVAGKSNN